MIEHPISCALKDLVELGGGGVWPPRATYTESWPDALQPYHQIFRILAALIPVEKASLDDVHNRQVIDQFRSRFRAELEQGVDLCAVKASLAAGDHTVEYFPSVAWMGFLSCMAYMRHAYRWGVVPIVREAQNETTLQFPEELDVPWAVLQQRFGITSPSGSLTSIVYYSLNEHKEMEYSCTVGMPDIYRRTERMNAVLFYELEERALPMYKLMATAVENVSAGQSDNAADALQTVNEQLKHIFKHFNENLVDRILPQKFWMAYVQGFHGWSLEGVEGVSGGHALVIRALDAFLGIRPWPSPEVEALHLPLAQRNWLNAMRDYDIRHIATSMPKVTHELEHMVRQLRLWRMSHIRRMIAYESIPLPERKKMVPGVEDPDEATMVKHLHEQLSVRLAETK